MQDRLGSIWCELVVEKKRRDSLVRNELCVVLYLFFSAALTYSKNE